MNDEDFNVCSEPIILQHLEKVLADMNSNKSPGSDGLTAYFTSFGIFK